MFRVMVGSGIKDLFKLNSKGFFVDFLVKDIYKYFESNLIVNNFNFYNLFLSKIWGESISITRRDRLVRRTAYVIKKLLKKESILYSRFLIRNLLKPVFGVYQTLFPNMLSVDSNNCNNDGLTVRLFYNCVTKKDEYNFINIFGSVSSRRLFGLTQLVDLFVTDRLGQIGVIDYNRFLVTYVLFNPRLSFRLLIEIRCSGKVSLPSLSSFYKASDWAEREVWDMHGVKVKNHPDLRRILTDYGFRGFPLRKDFPTVGFLQVRFDEKTESVVYESTQLMQEERESPATNVWGSFVPILKVVNYSFYFHRILYLSWVKRFSNYVSFVWISKNNNKFISNPSNVFLCNKMSFYFLPRSIK